MMRDLAFVPTMTRRAGDEMKADKAARAPAQT
jgi:hypothetical protein